MMNPSLRGVPPGRDDEAPIKRRLSREKTSLMRAFRAFARTSLMDLQGVYIVFRGFPHRYCTRTFLE